MDDDFDFLRYLDFGTSNGGPPPLSAGSATTSFSNVGSVNMMNMFGGGGGNSYNGGGSTSSSYASPQDNKSSSNTSEWSVSSPSGSSVSFPKSPLFGSMNSMPSLFDSSFSWDPIKNVNTSNNSSISTSSNSSSGNSPPFDLSIYGSSNNSTLSDENNIATGNNYAGYNGSNTSMSNGNQSYGNAGMPDNSNGNAAALTQQWQQLLLQQAQLQLQMQLQQSNNGNNNAMQQQQNQVSPVPPQQGQFNMPFPQVQAMLQQQQQQQQQSQQQQMQQPPMQHNQAQAQVGPQHQTYNNNMQSTPQMAQQAAPFQISTEDWSSRVSSGNVTMQSQVNTNVVPTPSPPENYGQSQSMPNSYMPMQANMQQQQYQPQRSLSPTEVPLNMQTAPKPIAPLPKREGAGVAIMPTGAAQHVSSVKSTKIAKTGLKRSYQQVKQEDPASDEENKKQHGAGAAPSMSRSASAETSSGSNSGNDVKGEKKTPGGHNAVEQKYRRGINDSLITLREIVPALQHLRVLPGMENAQRKQSQFSLSASVTPAAPTGFVDGVMAPTKLSKQLILVTATDYIRFLQNRRMELEGELETYKNAIKDCVEDPQVVINLAESRWYPTRLQILRDREDIYASRVASKENNKKQAKLERQKNASSRKADGTAGNGEDGGSDDDDDDEDDEDDDEMEGVNTGSSSAMPAKAQPKPRGRKPAANNKKAAAPRKKSTVGNAAAAAPRQTGSNGNDGSSKALMSVFAGVSFVGGAGYDMLFGSSAAARGNSETVSPGQVWSRGNILRRRGVTVPIPLENTEDLPALQAFFLLRPALLSGLVMLSLAVVFGYIAFYVLPALWKRINGTAQEARRVRARETLVQKTKMPTSVDAEEEIQALACLAGAATGTVSRIIALPLLLSNFFISFLFGNAPSHFDMNEEHDIEEAASALRLLELSSDKTYFSRLVAFLHLYNMTRSSAWPSSRASIPLLARAHAVLALTMVDLFGERASKAAASVWKQAQDVLKKEDTSNGWLAFALGSTFEEARLARKSTNPVYEVAEARAQSMLARAWPAVFTEVVNATTFTASTGFSSSSSSATTSSSSSTAEKVAEINEILLSLPRTSSSYALALLAKGIQALGKNDKATAVNVALHLVPSHAQTLASVRAFSSLVSGHPEPASFGDAASNGVDTLAYSTIAWLSIRQIAKASLSTTSNMKKQAEGESEGTEQNDDSDAVTDEAGLQMATIRLRKLLATEAFTNNVDEGFVDAQDRCVEQLVNIGRQAAGLDALSDSGCEL